MRKLKDLMDDALNVTGDVSPYELIAVKNDEKRVLLFDNLKSYDEFHPCVTALAVTDRRTDR